MVMILLFLVGCGGLVEKYGALQGPDPELNASDIAAYTAQQQSVLLSLAGLAFPGAKSVPAAGSPDWYFVVLAGADYVDQKCDTYINALFWFNRWQNSTKSTVALTGAATAAAMGVLRASVEAISLTATAFGLVTGLIDVGSNTVLYSIDPTALRTVLKKAQAAYRDGLASNRRDYTNEAFAIQAVQGYLALCIPAGLESLINNAVTTSTVEPGRTPPGNPIPRITVNPPAGSAPGIPPAPRVIVPGPSVVLAQAISSRKNALERYIREVAAKVKTGTAPRGDLDNIANAIGAPASATDTPDTERSKILAFIEALLNSDPRLAEKNMNDLSAKLTAAGIRPPF
jgi:hypothetical protein